MIEDVRVDSIVIGKRCRKDLGDIDKLAASISDVGLLQPIVIQDDRKLVVGHRRLAAFQKMGRETIPAMIVDSSAGAAQALKSERDENVCRKGFTPEEAVRMGEAILEIERPRAAARRARGQPAENFSAGREGGRSLAVAADAVGMSRTTLSRAIEVCNSGDEDLIEEMNRTGRVSRAYQKLKSSRKKEVAEPIPAATGKFNSIVVDPWDVMELGNIPSIPVQDMADENCILWLWAPNRCLQDAFDVAEAWGFEYKTTLTVVKPRLGPGEFLRDQTEHCLVCVKGKPDVNLTNQSTAIVRDSGHLNGKPEEFYYLVESLSGGSRAEIYPDAPRDGWSSIGRDYDDEESRWRSAVHSAVERS